MARSAAQRMQAFRERRQCGLECITLDIDMQAVIDAGLLTPQQSADAEECRRVLSAWIDALLQSKAFSA